MNNIRLIFKLIVISSNFFGNIAMAQLYEFTYFANEGEKIDDIYEYFLAAKLSEDQIKKDIDFIKSNNSEVTNWRSLEQDQEMKLYFKTNCLNQKKYSLYINNEKEKLEKVQAFKQQIAEVKFRPAGLKGSIHILPTIGKFKQKAQSSGSTIEYDQKLNQVFGVDLAYFFADSNWSLTSDYFQASFDEREGFEGENVSFPNEVGWNFYIQRFIEKGEFFIFTGLDYEQFSVFNLRKLNTQEKVEVDRIKATYYTFGLYKAFTFLGKVLHFETSYSQIANTEEELGDSDYAYSSNYNGYKFYLYLKFRIWNDLFFQLMRKQHYLDGPDEMTITRTGIGFVWVVWQ